jgi:uncharacterized protein YegP (UPF0339 family)
MNGELYMDKAGEWRWRVKSGGNVTASSEEGFKSFEYAQADAERDNPEVTFEVLEPEDADHE